MVKQKIQEKGYYVEANGIRKKVIAVYESFTGWYWFVTKKESKVIWFGLVRGLFTEWGTFYANDLQNRHDIWIVPEENWSGCPIIEHVE